jgi:hypothetical protein
MKSKIIGLRISGTIFGIVCLIHLFRLVTKIPILICDYLLPVWVNVIGFWVTGLLAVWLFWVSATKDQ